MSADDCSNENFDSVTNEGSDIFEGDTASQDSAGSSSGREFCQPQKNKKGIPQDFSERSRSVATPTENDAPSVRRSDDSITETQVPDTCVLSSGERGDNELSLKFDAMPSTLGRYELEREIGRGGMGVVYYARQIDRGDVVALKTLPVTDAARLHQFKREFRALAECNHPNLVGLRTLEQDEGRWFFTMDFVEGVDFRSYVRPNDELDEWRLRHAFPQLIAGISELHRRRILHRDLKPSNVMVDGAGRVVILDFGLVLEFGRDDGVEMPLVLAGAPAYAAPEQIESDDQQASDLYAMGVMLYEALSGLRPFSSSNTLSMIQRKLSEDPSPLCDPSLPRDLADLAHRMVRRDPAERPTIGELREGWGVTEHQTPFVDGELIGRETQMAELAFALRQVETSGRPLAVMVSGKSGEGKTSLVSQFLKPLRHDAHYTVLEGRCYDRESVPFKAVDSLIDSLCTKLRRMGRAATELIPDDIGMLASLFPVMKGLDVVQATLGKQTLRLPDERQVRQRAFATLRRLLQRLAQTTRLVLFADDLQWGDSDSAELLGEILCDSESPPVLFIGSYRSDESGKSDFLHTWGRLVDSKSVSLGQKEIRVGPLSMDQCHELVAATVDVSLTEAAIESVVAEAGGNPFLLTDLLNCANAETIHIEWIPLSELIEQKLAGMPAAAKSLLQTVCVSGQSLRLTRAAQASKVESDAMGLAIGLRNERLLRFGSEAPDHLVDTYHDKVRESVLSNLPNEKVAEIHLRLAETIESELQRDVRDGIRQWWSKIAQGNRLDANAPEFQEVFDLAYHFDAAESSSKALTFSLLAAERARQQYSLNVAARNYEIAKRNSNGERAIDYRISLGFGETLKRLASFESASDQFRHAFELAQTSEERAQVRLCQGELALTHGAISAGIAKLEAGLEELGMHVPDRLAGLGLGITKNLVKQFRPLPKRVKMSREKVSEGDLLRLQILTLLSEFVIFSDSLKLMWVHLNALNWAYKLPPNRYSAVTYSLHNTMAAMFSLHGRGRRFGKLSSDLAKGLDDNFLIGEQLMFVGLGCAASARFREGEASLIEAVDLLKKTGGSFELNLATFHLACCQFGQGHLEAAVETAKQTLIESAQVGDSRTMCASWIWARGCDGDLPFDDLRPHLPERPDDVMSTVHRYLAEASWHSHHGRSEEMLDCCERAAKLVRENRCLNSHTFFVLPMLARASRERAAALLQDNPIEAQRLNRRALRLAKWASRFGRMFPAAYPFCLRELASVYQTLNKPRKAYGVADRSVRVAARQGASYEEALSRLLHAQVAAELKMPEAETVLDTAKATLAGFRKQVQMPSELNLKRDAKSNVTDDQQ